jgi:hypothetical protein
VVRPPGGRRVLPREGPTGYQRGRLSGRFVCARREGESFRALSESEFCAAMRRCNLLFRRPARIAIRPSGTKETLLLRGFTISSERESMSRHADCFDGGPGGS